MMIQHIENSTLDIDGTVAVVGSSAALLRSGYGLAIDSHDTVVRFNRAPVAGFESDVGSRTNIRVVNPHVFACKQYGEQDKDFVKKQKDITFVIIGPENKELDYYKHYKNIDESCDSFKMNISTLYRGLPSQPTVGMAFIKALYESGITPSVYGFYGIPGLQGIEGLTHYWEERSNSSVCHNYSYERAVLNMLHEQGKINWIN